MQRLNPTGSLLRARPFVARHDYIFTLLCLLNVNMGALNTSAMLAGSDTEDRVAATGDGDGGGIWKAPPELSVEMVLAQGLLDDMAGVFQQVGEISCDACASYWCDLAVGFDINTRFGFRRIA